MKLFFTVLCTLFLSLSFVYAVEEGAVPQHKNCVSGELETAPYYDGEGLFPIGAVEENDPLEPLNRGIFWVNQGIDYLIIEPIAGAYKELVPEYVRTRIGFILRNLNEPIILVNNLLQGELEDARGTIWRFIFNSTIGIAGMFDVSTELGIPYKKEDLGLTFASWGIESGPYLVLPVLGPSSVRDAWGRIGDYAGDPINWLTFGFQSTSRSAVQILDAKTDNIEITDDIKKNAIDYYASIRSWYIERRKDLMIKKEDREALDSPRPDEDEDEEDEKEVPDFSHVEEDE